MARSVDEQEADYGRLTTELEAYCAAQSIPYLSADELIHEELTPEQRRWVSDFILRWEAVDA